MPCVRARCYEKTLARGNRVQADGAVLRVVLRAGPFALCHVPEPLVRVHVELVQLVLPAAVQLQAHLDTSKDHLLASLEVYTQLDDIPIIDREWLRFLPGRAQSYMIEERATAALHIPYVPLPFFVPKLTVAPAHDLGLEAYWCCRGNVHGHRWLAVSFGVASYAYHLVSRRQGARHRGEVQGGSLASRVDKDGEPYGGQDAEVGIFGGIVRGGRHDGTRCRGSRPRHTASADWIFLPQCGDCSSCARCLLKPGSCCCCCCWVW